MGSQLDLFGAPVVSEPPRGRGARKTRDKRSAVGRPAGPAAPPALACPLHGPEYVCPTCAPGGDTDGCGFLHRAVCGGRMPLRACRACGQLRTHGRWNHADYWRCTDCAPLGSGRQLLMERSRALTNNRQKHH